MMTEQEAKALASELDYQRGWRVHQMNRAPGGNWSLLLLRSPNDGVPGLQFFHVADGARRLLQLFADDETGMIICL